MLILFIHHPLAFVANIKKRESFSVPIERVVLSGNIATFRVETEDNSGINIYDTN